MTDPIHRINNLNTQVGIANTNAVDSEVRKNGQIREQQQEIDRLRSNPPRSGSGGGASRMLLANANAENKELEERLLEWKHSNEAFKLLAKNFGAQLGLTLDEIIKAKDEAILIVAEQDANFSKTQLLVNAKDRLSQLKK